MANSLPYAYEIVGSTFGAHGQEEPLGERISHMSALPENVHGFNLPQYLMTTLPQAPVTSLTEVGSVITGTC